jgi:hypothetical protein
MRLGLGFSYLGNILSMQHGRLATITMPRFTYLALTVTFFVYSAQGSLNQAQLIA